MTYSDADTELRKAAEDPAAIFWLKDLVAAWWNPGAMSDEEQQAFAFDIERVKTEILSLLDRLTAAEQRARSLALDALAADGQAQEALERAERVESELISIIAREAETAKTNIALREKLAEMTDLLRQANDMTALAEGCAETLADKVEALDAELFEAVRVARSYGATTWADMNYPTKPRATTDICVLNPDGVSAVEITPAPSRNDIIEKCADIADLMNCPIVAKAIRHTKS